MTKNIYTHDWLIDNKYSRWYKRIICNASMRNISGYYEKHHIKPKSLGGSNSKNNLVKLTAKEHFLCHYLLTFCTRDQYKPKMIRAFMMMKSSSTNQDRYFNSRFYEKIRIEYSLIQSKTMTGKSNPQYGKVWVTNFQTKHCLRVPNDNLDNYLFRGYLLKRCLNFDKYDSHGGLLTKPRNKSKTKSIPSENDLHLYKLYKNGHSLRSLSKETSYSHVTLFNRFKNIEKQNLRPGD